MKIKAIGIAPYPGLKRLMHELAERDPELALDVELGDLEEGVEIAQRAEKKGYELVISRGGTASMIREAVSIPVVDISVSGYDMLRVLTLLKDYTGKVAIVGFPNISQGAATICDLLSIDVQTVTIHHRSEVEGRLKALRDKDVQVVLGDTVTVKTAEKIGLHGLLITSGRESVLEAFEEGKQVHRWFSRVSRKLDLYRAILDREPRGIVVVDEEKQMLYHNRTAEELFARCTEGSWMACWPDLAEVAGEAAERSNAESRLIRRDGRYWWVTGMGFADGEGNGRVLLFLQETRLTEYISVGKVKVKETVAEPESVAFNRIIGSSEAIREAIDKAKKYSRTEVPVWISGEDETGKELFATAIHCASSRGNRPFVMVECGSLKPEEWEREIFTAPVNGIFGLARHGTLYLKQIEQIPAEVQRRLSAYLESCDAADGLRWILSSSDDLGERVRRGSFDSSLYYRLGRAPLFLPPLRERKEDLADLIRLFIADGNSKYGKSVVGMEGDLLEEMKQRFWPGNIGQLKATVEALVLQSEGPYIRLKEAGSILKRLKTEESRAKKMELDWTGTLEQMEKQIIRKVLEEEGMNQTRAAKRLGINRSTLWRKLKEEG